MYMRYALLQTIAAYPRAHCDKLYGNAVTHSEDVGWWRTLIMECVTLFDYIVKNKKTFTTQSAVKVLHHLGSSEYVTALI